MGVMSSLLPVPSPTWASLSVIFPCSKLQRCSVPQLGLYKLCSPKVAGSMSLLQPENLISLQFTMLTFADQARAQETGASGRNYMVGWYAAVIPHGRLFTH